MSDQGDNSSASDIDFCLYTGQIPDSNSSVVYRYAHAYFFPKGIIDRYFLTVHPRILYRIAEAVVSGCMPSIAPDFMIHRSLLR